MRRKLGAPVNAVFRYADMQAGFIDYLKKHYSDYSIYRTIGYVQSPLVCNAVKEFTGKELIYEVKDERSLLCIYKSVHMSEQDIRLHKVYSAAVNRYMRYLQQI